MNTRDPILDYCNYVRKTVLHAPPVTTLAHGTKGQCYSCPVSNTIRHMAPIPCRVMASQTSLVIKTTDQTTPLYDETPPPVVSRFISAFDNGCFPLLEA